VSPGLRREGREEGREGRAALLGLATEARLARAATDASCSSFVLQSRRLTRGQDQTMACSCPQPHSQRLTTFYKDPDTKLSNQKGHQLLEPT